MLPEIADALERAGITTPFPIQEMTLSVTVGRRKPRGPDGE